VPAQPAVEGLAMAGFRGRVEGGVDLEIVPFPALTVFVDFGDAVLVDDANARLAGGSGVVGLAPRNVRGRAEQLDCLQLRFSPVLAYPVFGAAWDLQGTVVDLDDLWGRDAERVRARLHAAGSWTERFAIAQEVVEQRRATGRTVDPEVSFTWSRLVGSSGRARVEALATELGWSRQRLWSRFRDQIGIGPKHAARLIRFDRAVRRLAVGTDPARVAADSGYTDQSHLHRDVRAFAGTTPTGVAAAPWLDVDDVAWPTGRAGLGGTFFQDP
jgi:AraC-like DNA-binding protein